MLPHPYFGSFHGYKGEKLLKETWMLDLSEWAIFFMVIHPKNVSNKVLVK